MRTQVRLASAALSAICIFPMACDSDAEAPLATARATIRGRLATELGNQRASPRLAPGARVLAGERPSHVTVVQPDAPGLVLGAGVLDRDGRFVVGGLPPVAGPVIVRAMRRDEPVLQVLVPWLGSGTDVRTAPLGHETTIEAQAYLSLRAVRVDLDPIWLQAWVTEELAAGVADGSALAPALDAAMQTYLDLARPASGGRVPQSALPAALSEPWARLVRSLDEATEPAFEDAAWARFAAELPSFLQAQLGVPGLEHATATTAAAFTLRTALEADPYLAPSADAAVALGAWHEAHASQAVQALALAQSSAAELGAGLEEAYTSFYGSLARVVDREGVAAAEGALAARIGGRGGPGPLLDALVLAENPSGSTAPLAYVREVGREARGLLDVALDEATRASDGRAAISHAFAAFQARIALAVSLQAGELGPIASAFATSAATSASGGASALVDLPVPVDRVSIGGALRPELGLQHGASGLAAKLWLAGPITARYARLVQLDEHGKRSHVTFGRIDPATRRVVLPRAPRSDELRLLELYDERLGLVGGVIVPPVLAGQRVLETAPITIETTAESWVLAELRRRAGRADLGLLVSTIDDAVGAAVIAEDGAGVLAGALEVAQAVRERALGGSIEKLGELALGPYVELSEALARSPESANAAHARFDESMRRIVTSVTGAGVDAQADATAETARVLDAMVLRQSGAQSVLAAAVDARARLDNARAAVLVVADALSRLEPRGWLDSGLVALADLVARAETPAALPQVGYLFRLWLVGDGRLGGIDGLLELYLGARYPDDASLAFAYAGASDRIAEAARRWAAESQALVDEALGGVGALDVPSLAGALSSRHAVFRKTALAAATLEDAGALSERDAQLIARTLVTVAEGLYAAPASE